MPQGRKEFSLRLRQAHPTLSASGDISTNPCPSDFTPTYCLLFTAIPASQTCTDRKKRRCGAKQLVLATHKTKTQTKMHRCKTIELSYCFFILFI